MLESCEAASAHPGDVVLRTDGRTDGLPSLVPYANEAGRPAAICKPVYRRPPTFAAFVQAATDAALVPNPDPRSQLAFTSGMYVADQSACPVDCGERVTRVGRRELAVVTVCVRGDDVELRGSEVSRDLPAGVPGTDSVADVRSLTVRVTAETAPAMIRRLAAGRDDDVRLRFEFAGGRTDVTAAWSDDHYELRVEPGSSCTAERDGAVYLVPVLPPTPTLQAAFCR